MHYNPRVIKIGSFPFAAFETRKAELRKSGVELFDFGVGDPVEPTPEFIREAVGQYTPRVSQYPSPRGIPELRGAISDYLNRRFQVKLDPETQIMPTVGSKEAVFNITFLFGGPENSKNIVIGAAPGYFVVEKSTVMNGMEFFPCRLSKDNGYLLDLEAIPAQVLERTALAWINYPHNPTGSECTKAYLARQAAVARKYGFLLCSDETYIDLYFQNPAPSVLEVAEDGVLAFHSCSKRSAMTAYRSGFVAGDREVIQRYMSYRNTIGAAPPVFTQHAARLAWSDDEHVAVRREAFAKKKALFLPFLKKIGLAVHETNATFYIWCRAPAGLTGQTYALKLLEQGIVVSPGDFFGEENSAYIRIALAPALEACQKTLVIWDGV